MFLNCKTFFSLRYGTMPVSTLVDQAAALGIGTLALTNINLTADAWEFIEYCQKKEIKPILGIECRNQHELTYLLLAKNAEGWYQINHFLSLHLQQEIPFPKRAPQLPGTFAIYSWGSLSPADLLPNELIGIKPWELNKLFRVDTIALQEKLVVLHPVTFQDAAHFELHRLLRAIDQNILITQLSPDTTARVEEQFVSPAQMIARYADYPHIIRNTLKIMEACDIRTNFHKPKNNKKYFTKSKEEDQQKLRELAMQGMLDRYGPDHAVALERIEKELAIVAQMEFEAYFLITWDIIRFAQKQHFFYVGRGSGANSIVAYCLKITDVDPIELDLYFERFLNPYRSSPPDFDIDFSWRDRDAIIQYVFEAYGEEHTALLGTVTTFQKNAVIRELGKVYGLPKKEIDKILENGFHLQLEDDDGIHQKIAKYTKMMDTDKSYPNHMSIHAGGILISEAPIHYHCTTYLPPKGFVTAQMDMWQAERIGLFKFDILSQRGLGHIRDAMEIIKKNKHVDIDIHNIKAFQLDSRVKKNLETVNTIGCFYIESPAMRQLLLKLHCSDYLSLVAASSIIRPGVAQSGMMKQYIQRYRNPEQVTYIHPIIEELLHETFGIMVYQEDVIKVAHHFADLPLADADTLRRAMAGKYRGADNFTKIEKQFFDNCTRLGRPPEVSAEIWRQIASFANYSFSKAHSASFAVESYQSLYLKTYFPAEFMVAVINNFGGFYNRELYFRELKKTGVDIHPPCINNSDYYTNIKGNDVFVGLIHIEGLEESLAANALADRQQHGSFVSLEDFAHRMLPGSEQLEILIRIGCFNFTGFTKKELLWKSSLLVKNRTPTPAQALPLFGAPTVNCELPALAYHSHEDAFDEIDLLGFPLQSPFSILQHEQTAYVPSRLFHHYINKPIITLGYFVTIKYLRSNKGEPMCFGTFLDKEGAFIDTVHFPDSLKNYPFQKGGFYILEGKVISDYDVLSIDVHKMRKIGYFEDKKS